RPAIAADDGSAALLFEQLRALADLRAARRDERLGGAADFAPAVVVVVQPPMALSARDMARFLEAAPSLGFSIIWLDEDRARLPRECGAITDVGAGGMFSNLTFTDGAHSFSGIES